VRINPLIGIAPGYFVKENAYWHMTRETYSQSIWKADGVPLLLTYPEKEHHVSNIADQLNGLILTGGPDLPIKIYGGAPYDLKGEEPMHPARVSFDRKIFDAFAKRNKPILAICAGIQLINVMNGGTLYEDVPSQLKGTLDHGDYKGPVVNHAVEIHQSSLLRNVLGSNTPTVNSTHHQGIRDLGKNLTPVAYAPDGLIEAVESVNGEAKFLAIQWHPEQMQHDEIQMKLFKWLVEEAAD
jgi:putative glutamine amidotransferase